MNTNHGTDAYFGTPHPSAPRPPGWYLDQYRYKTEVLTALYLRGGEGDA